MNDFLQSQVSLTNPYNTHDSTKHDFTHLVSKSSFATKRDSDNPFPLQKAATKFLTNEHKTPVRQNTRGKSTRDMRLKKD